MNTEYDDRQDFTFERIRDTRDARTDREMLTVQDWCKAAGIVLLIMALGAGAAWLQEMSWDYQPLIDFLKGYSQ